MKSRLSTGLLAAVLVTQGLILYRQYMPRSGPRQETVRDVSFEMELRGLPLLGNRSANVVLVEFSDFECPFCQQHASGVGQELKRKFVSPGHILYAFANNPLPMHGNAKMLASSAVCVGDEHFWEMHDIIFRKKLRTMEEVLSVGIDLGLNETEFRECITVGTAPAQRIQDDLQIAQRLELRGTPAFALGVADGSNRVTIRKVIVGAQPLEVFEKAIDTVLKRSAAKF